MVDFLEQLATKLKDAAKKPNVLSYRPNSDIHEDFHKAAKVGRILRGGNRSGKSVAGTVESVWRSTGKHPYLTTHEVPTRGRIVTVDRDSGIKQIILPLLQQWVPHSERVNGSWTDSWSNTDKLFTFRNGSTIEIKTHQQEVESFAGVPLHWCWFDEEPPQAIFNECRLRLIDYNGCWYMTMTPVAGQDWIFERFITTSNKNVAMFEVDIGDNPHLNKQALELLDDDLDDDEKKVRRQGIFVPKGGLVLTEFEYSRHIIEGGGPIPKSWGIYVSIDHGFNNPTSILWHAQSPQGDVVTFSEIYRNKTVIKDYVRMIKERNRELGVDPILYIGDPAMSQSSAITGTSPLQEYRMQGIPLMQAKKDASGAPASVNKMNEYLKYDKWHITEACPNTIKEIRGYAFKIYNSPKISDRNNKREEPNPKNNHSIDSIRYYFTLLPFLDRATKSSRPSYVSKTVTNREDFDWEVDSSFINTGGSPERELGFGEVW